METSKIFQKKISETYTTIILCHAILNKIESPDTIEIWNKKLINPIMPVHVIVTNDGKSIVIFDNWYSMGYGLEVLSPLRKVRMNIFKLIC